jgi:hypothetical protein
MVKMTGKSINGKEMNCPCSNAVKRSCVSGSLPASAAGFELTKQKSATIETAAICVMINEKRVWGFIT